jgi:hypothetical protein
LSLCISALVTASEPELQNESPPPDGGIFRLNGRLFEKMPGAGVRISVGPDGAPWIVNSGGIIYRWVNDTFEAVAGRAKDVAVGADGTVWKIGWDNSLQKWNGHGWDRMPGSAVTISIQPDGSPWIVNANGEIHRWVVDHFELQPGRARDIGVEKSVWIIDDDGLVYALRRDRWIQQDGAGNARRISVGPDGAPWVINSKNEIYHLTGDSFNNSSGRRPPTPAPSNHHVLVEDTFEKIRGVATDIGVGADGSVWIVGIPATAPPSGLGSKIGSIFGGEGAKSGGGSIQGRPPRGDAGPVLGGSSESKVEQGFRYAPSVIPGNDSVLFKFVTKLSTIPTIEISRRPPQDGRFDALVSSASPVESGKQTRHDIRLENLKPGTHYYYIITITDDRGRTVIESGDFMTSIRIDPR